LLKVYHPEPRQVVQSFNLRNTIALKPKSLDVLIAVKTLNSAEAFIMQIKRIVQSWSGILAVFFTKLLEISVSNVLLSMLILVHNSDLDFVLLPRVLSS